MEPEPKVISSKEAERLSYLAGFGLSYEDPIAELQALAAAASHIAQTPLALVSIVDADKQHFIAKVGLPETTWTSRDVSFCAHTLEGTPRLVVPDATLDDRFSENPLVTGELGIRAYAGQALEPEPGKRLGALCVVDHEPRNFEPEVLERLEGLARAATAILSAQRDKQALITYLDEEHRLRNAAQAAADQDPLTACLNQTAFRARVSDVLERSARPYRLALIDLDHFKYINDHLGHSFGDQLLIDVSKAIASTLGPEAILSRIGADEFGVLLPHKGEDNCLHRIEAMRLRIRRTAMELGQEQLGRVSVGLSGVTDAGQITYEALYQQADVALCAAKDSGRNRAVIYAQELDAQYNLSAQRTAFFKALNEGHILPYFQPKVDLTSGRIVSFELLVRWQDPVRGVLEPHEFTKLLSDRAVAPELSYQMIKSGIDIQNRWRASEANPVRFAINLTVHDLSDAQFVDDLDWRLKEAGLHWADFTFEVTETVIMGNPDGQVYRSMERIRDKGSEVSLDDFGTGFAGLAHLRDWPIDSVKIDREFVRSMTENPKDDMIVASIISLAHRLDLEVIAEGIETREVAHRLMQLGCDRGQGYFFSRPVEAETAFAALMKNTQDVQPDDLDGWALELRAMS